MMPKVDLDSLIPNAQAGSMENRWLDIAETILEGRTIISIRYMTATEAHNVGLSRRPMLIGLDDATILYAGEEGTLQGFDSDGTVLTFAGLT